MGSSQDSLGSWDERLQLATAMSEVTEADSSVLHEVHERMLDSQREEVQRRREGLAVSEAAAAVSPATILASKISGRSSSRRRRGLNLSKTLLRSRMSGSPVNELSAPPRGARRYFIRSSRLATALHISASKQKCSRAAVSALQRRSDAIPHEVPCTENEVAAMGR